MLKMSFLFNISVTSQYNCWCCSFKVDGLLT